MANSLKEPVHTYSMLGSYDMAWKSAMTIGLVAGVFQMTMNVRPAPRVEAERARDLRSIVQSG